MAEKKYSKNVIYRAPEDHLMMLDAICDNHTRSRGSMLRYLVQEEYRAMKKQEKADG